MSKELDKTTEDIMNKINKGQIKMRPKMYFIFGYILLILGLVFSFITSIFFVGITRFALRSHGPMGEYRLEQLLSTFSWWMPLLAISSLIVGVWLLRRYNLFYKINFKLLIIGIISSVLIAGFVIDLTGLNDFWMHKSRGTGNRQRQFRILNNFPPINK